VRLARFLGPDGVRLGVLRDDETLVDLTAAGREEAERTRAALEKLGRAYEQLLAEAGADLFEGLWRLDMITDDGALLRLLLRSADEAPDGAPFL